MASPPDTRDTDLPRLVTPAEGAGRELTLSGPLTLQEIGRLDAALADAGRGLADGGELSVRLSGVTRMDTAGAWALVRLERAAAAAGTRVSIAGLDPDHIALLETVRSAMPEPEAQAQAEGGPRAWVERLGRKVVESAVLAAESMTYLGLFLARLADSLLHPSRFRLTSLVHHCHEVGVRAVPIVALMAFLIGVVLAFQGSVQLRQFGAEVFVVELIAISILRELGILLTAIIVAGRTASAFTAAIGSMKMREEIDAMRTLGIDPAAALFVPRILALLIMLPILGLIANVAGIFGGAMMAWIELGISPTVFHIRLVEEVAMRHAAVGFIKAPAFALIIGLVGCHAGMKVERDAESLGRMTSNAVVAAIFAVILADALFSVFFAKIGM